jgi:hypothetical protein
MTMCMEIQSTCLRRKERRPAIEVDMWWSLPVMGLDTIEVRIRSLLIYVTFMLDKYFCFALSVILHKGSILLTCSSNTDATKQSNGELIWIKHTYMREMGSIPSRFQRDCYIGWSKIVCTPDDYSTVELMIWRWPEQNKFVLWTVLYWTRSSRTQFGVTI